MATDTGLVGRVQARAAGWGRLAIAFAAYALVVGILFIFLFKNPGNDECAEEA